MVSVAEQDSLAEQVWFGPSVHLSFGHLDAVDVAFDSARTVGQHEPGGDRGPVFAQTFGESAQLASSTGRPITVTTSNSSICRSPLRRMDITAVSSHPRARAFSGAGMTSARCAGPTKPSANGRYAAQE